MTASDMAIIETHDLTRTFRRPRRERTPERPDALTVAVDHVNLRVDAGEAVGYIGANGAGKSTTIKMLMGILLPTSGSVRTCGLDPQRHRRRVAREVGVVFGQRSQLWWDLPTRESFRILAAIHHLTGAQERERTDELVEQLEMGDFWERPVRQLSLGERMRAEVAAALLHHPRLVVLDEPTIGLDVLSKQRLRDFLVARRREHGTTLLLTTHDMGDIQRLCDRVLVVDHGRMVFDGSLDGLSRTVGAQRLLVLDLERPAPDLRDIPGTRFEGSDAGGLRQRLAFDPTATTAVEVLAHVGARAEVHDLTIKEPDIEDVVRRIYRTQRRGPASATGAAEDA